MKIAPISNTATKKLSTLVKNDKFTTVKPIKNYAQYLKEYGLKPVRY